MFCLGLVLTGLLLAAAGLPFGILTRMTPVGDALQMVPWNLWSGGILGTFLLVGTGIRKKWVAPRALTFLGRISYGLYLYHLLVFFFYNWIAKRTDFEARLGWSLWMRTWVTVVFAGLGSVALAQVSRTFFEEPFLRLKDRWTPKIGASLQTTPGNDSAVLERKPSK